MSKKLPDEERLQRRTCPRCEKVFPHPLRTRICKECIELPLYCPDVILRCSCGALLDLTKDYNYACPDWCPMCKVMFDDPLACYD